MKILKLKVILMSCVMSLGVLNSGMAHASAADKAARILMANRAAAQAAKMQRQAQAAVAARAARDGIVAAENTHRGFAAAEAARRAVAASQAQARASITATKNAARIEHGTQVVRMRHTPQIANDLGHVKAGSQHELLLKNGTSGRVAELNAANDLRARGYQILGSQVSVRTAHGLRRVDHVVKAPDGKIFATEVKWGNASRTATQIKKDDAMLQSGGTLVGKNIPADLRGSSHQLSTLVLQY